MIEYRCKVCKGTDVEIRIWINPNSSEIFPPLEGVTEEKDQWCNSCESHTEIILEDTDTGQEVSNPPEYFKKILEEFILQFPETRVHYETGKDEYDYIINIFPEPKTEEYLDWEMSVIDEFIEIWGNKNLDFSYTPEIYSTGITLIGNKFKE